MYGYCMYLAGDRGVVDIILSLSGTCERLVVFSLDKSGFYPSPTIEPPGIS